MRRGPSFTLIVPAIVALCGCNEHQAATRPPIAGRTNPVILPASAYTAATLDQWRGACTGVRRIYGPMLENKLGDTLLVLDVANDLDSAGAIFGLRRGPEGYWYEAMRGEAFPQDVANTLQEGPWRILYGEYESQIWSDDVVHPADSEVTASPEHFRQSWFLGFATISPQCAAAVAWRSAPVGTMHGHPGGYGGINEDSLHSFFSRISLRSMNGPVMQRDLRDLATRYAAAWSSQDPDRLAAFYADSGTLVVNAGAPSIGRAAIRATVQSFMAAFPDMVVRMDSVVDRGDKADFHWTWTGTNTGPGGTGRPVRITGYEEWTLEPTGLIRESRGHYDEAEYHRQVDLVRGAR